MLKQESVQVINELIGLNKTFTIVHNFEQFGSSLKSKFEEWFSRQYHVKDITEVSFCLWVMKSSNGLYVAMTREVYDLIHG
jgi:hypothetical protein